MAVASDAIYGARTVASYVSSSAYYGYVPLCRRESEPMISGLECGALLGESSEHTRYAYDSPMETDDDGHDCSTASRRLNNHCLIPEESTRHRWQLGEGQYPPRQQQQQQAVPDAAEAFLRRRNRKRCNADFGPAAHCKKLREGGGNGRVYYGTGSTKEDGLAAVRYEPAPLHLSSTTEAPAERISNREESCCWAAGNCSLLSNTDCMSLFPDATSNSTEGCVEYEKVLFETHGCSVYHHYRLQLLDDNSIEAEF